ncbi:TetR/AcrR family transcriptional regulator [Breoghania sp. L-A4]|uniref:TetR/AcrR family transcriptional regulator n=1 Tax=Breoghania sp. L-A4 TaxID=2304600 RepID=UPI000E35D7E9|nr:TetR/AcrR family transcriptional regulator [Breoghania sp. L-A4]AXS38789.1 TetR/AcrR family transcriptional regulator [Breoghania sp. L-A4]
MAEKRDAERTRARLLDVAISEFAQHGYDGARVTRVVRAANVTARMLYHYFGDKEGLYVAVLDSVYAQIRDMSRPLIEALDALIARGVAEGAFLREHVDPLQLYVSIVAMSAHHINNLHTLSAVFGADLAAAEWIEARRAHTVAMVLRYVGAEPSDPLKR